MHAQKHRSTNEQQVDIMDMSIIINCRIESEQSGWLIRLLWQMLLYYMVRGANYYYWRCIVDMAFPDDITLCKTITTSESVCVCVVCVYRTIG